MKVDTLAQHLLFSTVRITEDATPEGPTIGTGFVFAYELDPVPKGRAAFFVVTNKHVIKDADEGSLVFIKNGGSGKPLIGQGVQIPILHFEDHWHGHPNADVDVAVMPLLPMLNHRAEPDWPTFGQLTFVAPVRSQHLPTSDSINNLDAVEDVFFIGYPDGLYDTVNLTPVARRGITATPVQLDFEGQPAFLIDAAVFPGSSGSPVFAASTALRVDEGGNPVFTHSRSMLLGVIAEYLRIKEDRQVEWKPIPTAQEEVPTYTTKQALNLGVVYKSSTIEETILDLYNKSGGLASVPWTLED